MKHTNKIMLGTIVVLTTLLLVQTGYLIGSRRSGGENVKLESMDHTSNSVPLRRPSPQRSIVNKPVFDQRADVWDPFEEIARMQEEMNRTFNNTFGLARQRGLFDENRLPMVRQPNLDVREKADHYLYQMDVPGLDKERVQVQINEHSITITGERTDEKEVSDDQGIYRLERSSGFFSRTVPLPNDADRERIEANVEKGVLTIRIPKMNKKQESESLEVEVN